MKKLLLFFCLIAAGGFAHAQDTINPNIPPYKILTTDSTFATPAKLKKGHKVMIMYFSPDCPHCQHLMYDLKPKMKQLGDTEIVMITWSANYDIRAIKNFRRDFGLAAYPNLIIGTEGYTMVVMKYYHVTTTPFIAICNRQGKMVKSFDKPPKAEDVLEAVKKA